MVQFNHVCQNLRRLAALSGALLCLCLPAMAKDGIRVGWQTTWAVQGQLVMGLMHTDIGAYNGLDLEFSGFSYGGPLNQAAIGGTVDVLLTADQPALVLLDRSADFAIVGRMMYNRVCLYAPSGSEIAKVEDLAGKRVSGPVGAAAERVALDIVVRNGVELGKLTLGSLDMTQQSALLLAAGRGAKTWAGVDALYGFDPLPAAFEADGYAKMLDCDRVVSVVMMRESMLRAEPEKAAKFMCAFMTAWHQYALDKTLMNNLFLRESHLDVGHDVLDAAASLEPNFEARKPADFRFDFIEDDFDVFDRANRFLVDRGIVRSPVDVKARINLEPLRAAMQSEDCDAFRAAAPYEAAIR